MIQKICNFVRPVSRENKHETHFLKVKLQMLLSYLGGHRYFVTFIDDKSRFTAIYFVKNKDEVLQKFKEFNAWQQLTLDRESKIIDQIMAGSIVPRNLMISCHSKVFQSREVS